MIVPDVIPYMKKHEGTVSVIPREFQFEDANARFTTVPLKALSDQV